MVSIHAHRIGDTMSQNNAAGSANNNGDITDITPTYARLTTDQRAALMAMIDMTDPAAAMARLTELNSDAAVTDADAKRLGWIQTYTLGLTTQKRDKVVTRRKRTGRMGSLESFIATLDGGAVNIDPDTIVYVRDEHGDEVETTIGTGDEKRRVPLVEARGTVTTSGVSVRLDDGRTFPLANGKKATPQDVGGDENYRRITEFSRDGGTTWTPVVWSMRFPNARTTGANES